MIKNKIKLIFQFILTLVVLLILGLTIIFTFEAFDIIELPEKYSLLKFFPSDIEVSVNEYTNNVENTTKKKHNVSVKKEQEKNTSLANTIQQIQNIDKNYITDNNKKNKYYYSLLDEYGKIMYDKYFSNIENLKTGTYKIEFGETFSNLLEQEGGNKILERAFQSSLNAFIYDNPGVFYLDIGKMYLYTETKTVILKKIYNVYIGPEEGKNYLGDGFNSKQDVEIAIKQVNDIVNNIINNIADNDFSKIKTIHDYLIDNTEYDRSLSNLNIYNMYGALVNKETVCEGYTKAFKYILDEIGVECIFVFGVGTNKEGEQENHSWNYVKLEDNWYAVDVTWDDPIIIGGPLTNKFKYRYFLKGSSSFFKDHIEDGRIVEDVEFYYPAISEIDYQY